MSEPQVADLTIRSRRILTPQGWRDGVVVVRGEQIAEIVEPDAAPAATRHVDAADKSVIPGLIDTHVHLRDPGFTDKEDFTYGTRAAAAGGVTTIMDMPNVNPPTRDAATLTAHYANAAAKSLVDYGHNASAVSPENIAELADAGATAFKIFMMTDVGRDYPHMPGIGVDDHATLLQICEEVAKTGLPLFVHPHDQSIYELYISRAVEKWGRDYRSYAKAGRQGEGIVVDSGVALMICRAKEAGQEVTAEVNPQALFVANSWPNIESLGPFGLGVWIPEEHGEALWEETVNGVVDVVGTDHSPHTRDEKELGWTDMYATPGGSPNIEHYLSLFLTAVNAGRISLERVVEICSTNPARLMSLYPTKGAIAAGSDADLVVLDLERESVIRAADSHYKCGWTNLEGRTVRGVPVMTVLRGTVIAEEGDVKVGPGFGRRVDPMVTRPDAVPADEPPTLLSGAAQ
jgi:dihydroorotase